MRPVKDKYLGISTILSFALIPITGFATDVYLPSLPAMASELHVSGSAVQLSIILFMVSAGISQLFVGSLLDSFGRRRLGLTALAVFALASFVIALTHNIYVIYAMRVLHGIAVAFIAVGKRAFFMDMYSGEKLKSYTSLFSIVWATAPIIAPFLGGYLQNAFGWQSNFWLLGGFIVVILILELIFGGESLKAFQPFRLRSIVNVYSTMIRTLDFSLGLVVLALCYGILVVFNMSSPFIIEHVYHFSPVITGDCALLSGVSIMIGGIISKSMIQLPLIRKVMIAIVMQLVFAGAMIGVSGLHPNLYTMMSFVFVIHLLAGFIFNNVFTYCLGRFSGHAGVASGITGGGMFVLSSLFSYGLVGLVAIRNQWLLGMAYLVLVSLIFLSLTLFRRAKDGSLRASNHLLKQVPDGAEARA